jgi:signal peptidase I
VEAILLAALVAATAWVVRRHWWLTRVRSWSMHPTLHPGDLRITRALSGRDTIHRGDIVVIDSTELRRRVVKRIIGLPGETVQVTPGGICIDGEPFDEPYLAGDGGPTGTFRVPEDGYFVLGDNRHCSSDSRTWANPFPSLTTIRGRLLPGGQAATGRTIDPKTSSIADRTVGEGSERSSNSAESDSCS